MKGVIFIFLACLCWAIDTLFRYPIIHQGFNVSSIVFVEHVILCIFFSSYLFSGLQKLFELKLSTVLSLVFLGVIGSALATMCFTYAFQTLNPSVVILLQKLQPIVAIIFARILLGEEFNAAFFPWMLVTLAGGLLLSYEDILKIWQGNITGNYVGYLWALGAVFGWGLSTVFSKKLTKELKENEILSYRFFFGMLGIIPFLKADLIQEVGQVEFLGKVVLMVIISGLVGMKLYYRGVTLLKARVITLAEMSFPFFAVIINWIYLGSSLNLLQLAGGVLLLLGPTMIQLRRL